MGQAKLLKKKMFEELDLWFEPGWYEDAYFTAKLFSRAKEIHFAAVPFYYWIKYAEGGTISSSADIAHFRHKIKAMSQAWAELPGYAREYRLSYNISADVSLFTNAYPGYSDEEKEEFYNELRRYYIERKEYYRPELSGGLVRMLAKCFTENKKNVFHHVIASVAKQSTARTKDHNNV
jgi:hypothetical protein